jgi:hypothetical protein
MHLIRKASVALVLGFAVAMSAAPAGAATMHKHHVKVVKVVKAPHYKNLLVGFLEAVFHPVDHDKDKK